MQVSIAAGSATPNDPMYKDQWNMASVKAPQAWATASPLLWLVTVLGVDPDRPGLVDPHLPAWLGEVRVRGMEVRGERVDVTVTHDRAQVATAR